MSGLRAGKAIKITRKWKSVLAGAGMLAAGCVGAMAQTGSAEVQLGGAPGRSVDGKLKPRPVHVISTRSAPVSGPFLGYAWFPRRSEVRAILGIPGAAYMGEAVEMGGPFRTLAVSSAGSYALAVTLRSGKAVVVGLAMSGQDPISTEIPLIRENADRVILSPSGRAGGLYHRQSRVVELVKFLPHNPRPAGEVTLAGLPTLITAMAVSDGGEGILVAVSVGSGAEIYSVRPGSAPRFLTAVKRANSVSFGPSATDALVVDSEGSSVLLIQDAFGRGDVRQVAGSHLGLSQPSAAEFLPNGTRFLVADSGNQRIFILDRTGEILDLLSSPRTPVMLQRLDNQGTFQLSAPEQGAVSLLRTTETANEIFFAASSGGSLSTRAPQSPPRSRGRSAPAGNARGR